MIERKIRVILDTNLLISRVLTPHSATAAAVRKIIDQCQLLVSQATIDEFATILVRFQSKGYIKQGEVKALLYAYKEVVEWVPVVEHVQVCRDAKDDKFLDLAMNGKADFIVTGDKDLLVLHPFGQTKILSISDFIDLVLG